MSAADVSKGEPGTANEIRDQWLARLTHLVETVQNWGEDLGWSTRRIEKSMQDSVIGKYRAPALLLQQETIRVLLDPVARSAPGVDGVVDLYLMPAYDDIASLYYVDGSWELHYLFPDSAIEGAVSSRDFPSKPLTSATLREVLDAMKQNVA